MAKINIQRDKLGNIVSMTTGSISNVVSNFSKQTIKNISNSASGVVSNIIGSAVAVGNATEDIINKVGTFLNANKNNSLSTIDFTSLNGRNDFLSVIDVLGKLSAEERCNFTLKSAALRERLMSINEKNKIITLNSIGSDVPLNGNSLGFSNSVLQTPCYAERIDYIKNFVLTVRNNNGYEATQISTIKDNHEEITNLYPNEDNSSEIENTWQLTNQESLLFKHKQLYNSHKINTLISRFHTDSGLSNSIFDSKTRFGLSRGRNLLNAKAARNEGSYNINGYDNPFCRVWTHHHQYDRLSRLIRPFYKEDENGISEAVEPFEFHKWRNFKIDLAKSENEEGDHYYKNGSTNQLLTDKAWGWKDENDAWKQSVLGKNGFINIAPKYQNGGGDNNLHTKQCMFSIENLAWRDYNPYAFEQALSYEQRGPMGGRIMWFPPYGIQFNETTSAQWQNSSFIGRGEDIYTYTNTTRTGTLNFMLLVDHPSLLDYVSWGGRKESGNDKVTSDDVNRFFAGCDDMAGVNGTNKAGGTLSDYAEPTFLTDEYLEHEVIDDTATPELKPQPIEPEPPQDIPNEEPKKIIFNVFFPNNYSGCDDTVGATDENAVDPILYLLFGQQAQKKNNGKNNLNLTSNNTIDYLISNGDGYEIYSNTEGMSNEVTDNYISGKNRKEGNTKWFYRVDDVTKDQTLTYPQSRTDLTSYGLNGKVDLEQLSRYDFNVENDKNIEVISFVQFAYIMSNEKIKKALEKYKKKISLKEYNDEKDDFYNKIGKYLKKEEYKLTNITITGNSNSHGDKVSIDDVSDGNKRLANERYETLKNWIISIYGKDIEKKISDGGLTVGKIVGEDVSFEDAKIWRSSTVVLEFSTEESNLASDSIREDDKSNTFVFDVNDVANYVKSELEKEINPIVEDSEKDKECIAINNINSYINNFFNGYSRDYKNQLSDILTENSNINNIICTSLDSESFYNESYVNTLFKYILTGNITLVSNELFKDELDFENTLGKKISDTLEKESKNNNRFKTLKTEYEEIFNLKKEIDELNKKIDVLNNTNKIDDTEIQNKINNVKTSIEALYNDILKSNNLITYYDKQIKDIVQITTSKDYIHEKSKYEKLIAEEEKNKTKLSSDKSKKINEIEDLYNKLFNLYNNTIVIINNAEFNIVLNKTEKQEGYFEITPCVYIDNKQYDNISNGVLDYQGNKYQIINKIYNESLNGLSKELDDKVSTYTKRSNELSNLLNSFNNDVKDVVFSESKNNIKKDVQNYIHNINIDHYYDEDIVNKLVNEIKENVTINCNVLLDDEVLQILIKFNEDTYKKCNDIIIEKINNNDKNTYLTIDVDKLLILFNNSINYKYSGENKNLLERFGNTNINISFTEEDVKPLIVKLNEYNSFVDIDATPNGWDSIKTIIKDILHKKLDNITFFNVTLNEKNIGDLQKDLDDKLNKRIEALDKSEYVGFSKYTDENGNVYYINENETDKDKKNRHWVYDENTKQMVLKHIEEKSRVIYDKQGNVIVGDRNKLRYDQEYHFFRMLKEKDRATYEEVMQKIQYFNPAFHSMTPEGFSARLTFLQQCTRQGDTVAGSDWAAKSANNLAFGRPPYCILRLGDFFYQKIIIDNISINYDPLVWDLNEEGCGVIPLIANVSISFKFIGGGSMYGAVSRLQNAQTFNYYANSNLYDNRSDKPVYNWSKTTQGALNHDLNTEESRFYSVNKYNKNK